MLYALKNKTKTAATPNDRAICPFCGEVVIAKCGNVNIWHWSHLNSSNCDTWHDSETDWHLHWKSLFPPSWVEVSLIKYGEKHIADVLCPDGLVIEFQHSPISPEEIRIREFFYQNMLWVFDIRNCFNQNYKPLLNLPFESWYKKVETRFIIRSKGEYFSFRWKHPKKHIAYAEKNCYLDIGHNRLFQLKKLHLSEPPYGGWGYLIEKGNFIQGLNEKMVKQYAKT